MPAVSFSELQVGNLYNRNQLAAMWGYEGVAALQRGVVTPKRHSCIVLFVTREKQIGYQEYKNELRGAFLFWEGPTDHYAEDRIISSGRTSDVIHLFFRDRHHSDFEYLGEVTLESFEKRTDTPSHFVYRVKSRSGA